MDSSPPLLGLIVALVADGTILASLIYAAFYNWLVAANWPPPELASPPLVLLGFALLALAAAPAAARAGLRAPERGRSPMPWIGAGGLASLAVVGLAATILAVLPDPRSHAHPATAFMLVGYIGLHAYIGLLFLISNALRFRAGYLSARRTLDLRLTRVWQDYTTVSGLVILLVVLAMPALAPLAEGRP